MSSKAYPTVGQVMEIMEAWAPAWTAEPWDNVGLACGDPRQTVQRMVVALDLTDQVLEEALAFKAQMLLVHHPPVFKPLKNIRADNPLACRLMQAIKGDLAVFAAHTNLDCAPGGINDILAARLGLQEMEHLLPLTAGHMAKLVTFVPPDFLEAVESAIYAAGAGVMGNYSQCSFKAEGWGSFRPGLGAKPYLGQTGAKEQAREIRLETIIPQALSGRAIKALVNAHPYEEPAIDLLPLANSPQGLSLGRVGRLAEPLPFEEFARKAKEAVEARAVMSAGIRPAQVRKVAVLGGSGASALAPAKDKGADVLVTGEAGYHTWEEASDLGLGLLTLGHFKSENVVVLPWVERLNQELAKLGLKAEVRHAFHASDPWRTVV